MPPNLTKPASITCEQTTLTYADLAAQAGALAHSWLPGIQPGDRVALHMRNSLDLARCYYACFAAGFVAVPINNRRLTAEEINVRART